MADRCDNPGPKLLSQPLWTCPSCWLDLREPKTEGEYTCPDCGARLRLTIEERPFYVAQVVHADDAPENGYS